MKLWERGEDGENLSERSGDRKEFVHLGGDRDNIFQCHPLHTKNKQKFEDQCNGLRFLTNFKDRKHTTMPADASVLE